MTVHRGRFSGKGKKIGIVAAKFNGFVTRRLLEREVMEGAELLTLLNLPPAAAHGSPEQAPLPPGVQ
jgi:hypothetical protein